MRYFVIYFLLVSVLIGCATGPSSIFESYPVTGRDEIKITDNTVVIDARSPFEYQAGHLSGAINLRPQDFSQQQEPFKGLLDSDVFMLARRLARLGIDLDTHVVVYGNGSAGFGEEGRLAWMLAYLGVSNVQFAHIDYFSGKRLIEVTPPRENKAIWKPNLMDQILIDRETVMRAMVTPRTDSRAFYFLDVRTVSEYVGKSGSEYSKKAPDMGAINIPWVQFFNQDGTFNRSIRKQLNDIGIMLDSQIIVLDDMGYRSAAVTMALRGLGFSKAANYAGGYMELVGLKKSPGSFQ